MIQIKPVASLFALITLCLALAGCGEKAATADNSTKLEQSQNCIDCHDNGDQGHKWLTPGTQQSIVNEWKKSAHNTSNGAGCADCHEPHANHPYTGTCNACHTSTPSSSSDVTSNPDKDAKCAKCHDKTNPRPGINDGYNTAVSVSGMASGTTARFTHFSTGSRANYVSSYNKLNCRNCHNPHDTNSGREQRSAWAESGHGNTRGLARILIDGKTRGTNLPLDQNIGNNSYCVRCHTSTGFINFVANNLFTNVNALRDIGADGLPSQTGLQTNAPEYTFPRTGPNAGKIVNASGQVVAYNDRSREATNCNVCHLDTRSSDSSSYSGKLRQVAVSSGVKIYYPYSSVGYKTVTTVQFDTLGNSNLCLTCHSGRATGKTISEPGLADSVVALKNPSAPSIHDFAGGAVLQGEKSAFFFYNDPAMYKTSPSHRAINTDGNGPCVSCHMPKVQSTLTSGLIHSHLFRPVSWTEDDINQDITEIISNQTVCSSCHNGATQTLLTPAFMNQQRKGFRVSLLILGRLLPQTFNKPAAGNGGWTGINKNVTPNVTYGTSLIASLGNMPAAIYTMGASYNYSLLFNEPSSYNHSPILARQLIYDSIDWLIHGATGFGTSPSDVYTAIKNAPFTTTTTYPATKSGLYWTKVDVNKTAATGTSSNKDYAVYTDTLTYTSDRDAALSWLCKDYVSGDTACNRWQ